MQVRNTVVMALILVILAGFVYFYEIRGREAREEAERREELLVVFEPEEVARLRVEGDGEPVVAEKTEDGWQIVEPRRVPADDAALDGLVDDLSRATEDRLIAESPEDLATYGLEDPEARVVVTLEDGSEKVVALGKDTPVGGNLYALVGAEGDVYSAPRALRNQVSKSLLELRDRSILAFAEDEVQRVDLRRPDLQARLERRAAGEDEEATWRVTEPFEGRADGDMVSDLLDALGSEEVAAFVHEEAADEEQLAAWGLADPAMDVTVWIQEDASQRLLIGAESEEPEGYHATRAGSDAVFVIPAAVVEALPADADALRNREVLDLPRERVTALEVHRGDATIRVERDDADWRITEPRSLGADSSRVSQLLSTLVDLRADGFATADEAVGLESPELSVVAELGDTATGAVSAETEETEQTEETGTQDAAGAAETVQLDVGGGTTVVPEDAEEEAEPVAARYVRVSGDPTIYVVDSTAIEDLRVDLFALRDKTLVEFTQSDVTEIEVHAADDGPYRFAKDGEEWSLAEPAAATLGDPELLTDLLWDLNYLRMEGVATDAEEGIDLTSFGLAEPAYRIVVRADDRTVAEVSLGASAPADDEGEGRLYVDVEGVPGVQEVYAGLRDSVQALLEGIERAN